MQTRINRGAMKNQLIKTNQNLQSKELIQKIHLRET